MDDLTVVRVRTDFWHDSRGGYWRKSVTALKKKCTGHNLLLEDLMNMGTKEVMPRITNLMEVPDGIYRLEACDFVRDRETGYVDEYDYILRDYDE